LPEPPAPWSVVREVRSFGAVCPQYEADVVVGDEDCLTLNVWAPAAAIAAAGAPRAPDEPDAPAPRSVLVWIHGGGHVQGSSAVLVGDRALYDGQDLAAEHGLVVVTINYRLGPFGFLAHPALSEEGGETASGNYGMFDQLLALQWVRENAAAFGGDPARVTIAGQSAGAVSVCRLIASPLAEGLFHRAILHSGGCPATPLERAEANGQRVAADVGCAAPDDTPDCLRTRSMAEIMATLNPDESSGTESLARNAYDGVIDGYAVPEPPGERIAAGRHHHIPVIVGATSAENGRGAPPIADEAAFEAAVRAYFARSGLPAALADRAIAVYPTADYATPRDAYVALTSDLKFACTARNDARRFLGAQAQPVWRYWYDHVAENAGPAARILGAYHGAELPFLFGVLAFQTRAGRYVPGPGDLAVSAAMQGYWARFAATGNPNVADPAGDPSAEAAFAWPRYELTREPALRFAAPLTIEDHVRGAQCDFWVGLRP
jgi:para-nitrobenzyl esterase